jgi:hypothetical protein
LWSPGTGIDLEVEVLSPSVSISRFLQDWPAAFDSRSFSRSGLHDRHGAGHHGDVMDVMHAPCRQASPLTLQTIFQQSWPVIPNVAGSIAVASAKVFSA